MNSRCTNTKDKIKELRSLTGLSQAKFSQRYKIPLSTLENWERGIKSAPEYLIVFMEKTIKNELQTK